MPIVAHNDLPSLQRLREAGTTIVLPQERAARQDIRELHIGLLNMMPDAALEATERQFFRLIGESNPIAQFYVHPFTLDAIPRGDKAAAHIARYYEPFEKIREGGLEALIITGANVSGEDLSREPFWEPLASPPEEVPLGRYSEKVLSDSSQPKAFFKSSNFGCVFIASSDTEASISKVFWSSVGSSAPSQVSVTS